MDKIKSFTVDHDLLKPGIYISREDHGTVTYDLRTRYPNCGYYMSNITMHSVEHMLATFLRNDPVIGDKVIYFGPMGCRTGFYLIVCASVPSADVLLSLKQALRNTINYRGQCFGQSQKECGNYRELDLQMAQLECKGYLTTLESIPEITFRYPDEVHDD